MADVHERFILRGTKREDVVRAFEHIWRERAEAAKPGAIGDWEAEMQEAAATAPHVQPESPQPLVNRRSEASKLRERSPKTEVPQHAELFAQPC